MVAILSAVASILAFRFRSRASLELKLIALQHQLTVLRRQRPGRPQLSSLDRLLWVWLSGFGRRSSTRGAQERHISVAFLVGRSSAPQPKATARFSSRSANRRDLQTMTKEVIPQLRRFAPSRAKMPVGLGVLVCYKPT
jgi:hypothetical protein